MAAITPAKPLHMLIMPFSDVYVSHLEEALDAEVPICISEYIQKAVSTGYRPYSEAEQKDLSQALTRSALRRVQRINDECRAKMFLAFAKPAHKVIGLVAVQIDEKLIPPRKAEILLLGVAYRFRRLGVGKMLVEFACKQLRQDCVVEEVTVRVDARQEEVVSFCKALGFKKHCYEWSFPCTPYIARFHRFLWHKVT